MRGLHSPLNKTILPSVERKILMRYFCDLVGDKAVSDVDIAQLDDNLTTWAEIIRKTYDDGGVDAVITTRRLINIVKAHVIWNDTDKAIEVCTNRSDDDTKAVFTQLSKRTQQNPYAETPDEPQS